VQTDGKILVGGSFTVLGGQARGRIGRLHADGKVDSGFAPGETTGGTYSSVRSITVQSQGDVLVGGDFTMFGGQPRDRIARLKALELATQSLDFDGSTITWLRGGPSPEVWRTTFEHSSDGIGWTNLGAGMRIPGGWQLTGVAVPPDSMIRARGYVSGGNYNGSCWFVESVWPPAVPRILVDDGSFGVRSNRFGFRFTGNAGSSVFVQGSTDLTHWVSLQTNLMPSGPLYFSEPGFTNGPGRFYRLLRSP
jgi:hypothetical protein